MSYTLPTKTPFSYNVGICFHTNMCTWYTSSGVVGNRANEIKYSEDRLKVITQDFKLVRVYGFRVAGFDSSTDTDPCTQALINVMNADSNIEAVISLNPGMKSYLLKDENITSYFGEYATKFNTPSQVKAIMLGNEVNYNGYTSSDLTSMMTAIKANADYQKLNYPLTASFGELPTIASPNNKDNDDMVKAIVNNWDPSWNGGKPFVFINPYPDAPGIDNAAGVFKQQAAVQAYYASINVDVQIFIGETGAEGASDDSASETIIQSIFSELDNQQSAKGNTQKLTVPTFIFEGINEGLKPASPNQQFMGVYKDKTEAKEGADITLKPNITLPKWLSTKIG